VTNLDNGKSIEVRINDRMPNFKGRIIDLSLAAARKIEMINAGIQEVKLEVLRWGK
jgi:rare lipoprotein A